MFKEEVEVKFKVSKKEFLEKRNMFIKDFVREGRVILERNVIFDNGNLLNKGKLLRMRMEEVIKLVNKEGENKFSYLNKNKHYILTFKDADKEDKYFKVREEINILLNAKEAKSLILVLRHLGFEPIIFFEKKRLDFIYKNILISFCRLPVLGYFLEIEGNKKEILEAIKVFGLDIKKAIKQSFVELYLKKCFDRQNIFKFPFRRRK